MQDKVFGTLVFYPSTGQEESYWFTNLTFGPDPKQIDCTIYHDLQGVSSAQRDFYLQIERNYPDLEAGIEAFINTQFQVKSWGDKNIIIEKDIELYSIIIPRFDSQKEVNWEIEYREVQGFTSFEIQLKGWKPYWLSFSA